MLQAASELCFRLFFALPFASQLRRSELKPLRRSLKAIVKRADVGASRRASALQALAVWGGVKCLNVDVLSLDEDPLVRGNALVALAKRSAIEPRVVLQAMRDESPVVSKLAYEAAELLNDRINVIEEVLLQQPHEYWVVEKQRFTLVGTVRWNRVALRLRRAAFDVLVMGLGNADPRVRSEAARSLCLAAPLLGVESTLQTDNDSMVLEGAWKSVPSIACELLAIVRRNPSQHLLFGAHEVKSVRCSFGLFVYENIRRCLRFQSIGRLLGGT